jgi:HEAT repeat protein
LTEVERRRLFEDRELSERWVKLLREVKPAEVPTVARAAGARAHADVTAELVRLLASPDAPAAAAAAAALGVPGNEAAVAPLARAIWAATTTRRKPEATLQWAALQTLGRIASPAARAELTRAAREHPDTETRRAAQTELNLLAAKDARVAGSAGTSESAPASIDPREGSLEEPSPLRKYWKAWALFLAAALGVIAIVLRRRGVW